MKIDGTDIFSLINSANIIFSKQIQNILSNLAVIEVSIHLRILGLYQNASQSSVRITLSFMLLVEVNHHIDYVRQKREGELVIKDS